MSELLSKYAAQYKLYRLWPKWLCFLAITITATAFLGSVGGP